MEQTVYIDLYFLINFSMDLLCLFLASRLLSYKFSPIRDTAAAVLGGVYACVALLVGMEGAWGLLADLAVGLLLGIVALKRKGNFKQCIYLSLVFAATSILLGGFMTVLFSLFNRIGLDKIFGDDSDGDGVSVWLFALLALISGVLSVLGGRLFKKKTARKECKLKLTYKNKSVELTGLCDSGNLLCEPISGKPCIVVERTSIEKILPPALARIIDGRVPEEELVPEQTRLRIIPTQTVNGAGMLYAIRFDFVSIDVGGGECPVDAFVAVGELGRSADGVAAIVPSQLIMGAP